MKYTGILNYDMIMMYFTVFYSKYKCGVSVMLSKYPSHGGYFLEYFGIFHVIQVNHQLSPV